MMQIRALCLALAGGAFGAGVALADSAVATRTIQAQSILAAEDVTLVAADIPGALTDATLAVGREAKVTLYAGRPIRAGDLTSPALVQRNQTVKLIYRAGGLTIATDGRALERGAAGDAIHVMNLASHQTVSGQVAADGSVTVGFNPG